jgi:methyl-accepting chemotaxis protein
LRGVNVANSLLRWFSSLSIRWKLQLGFFMVTMLTTIYNRWLASSELQKLIDIAQKDGVAAPVIAQLQENHSAFIFNSFWESGIEFAIQFVIIGVLAATFVKPIKALCEALKAVEQGDLTKGVANTSHDEIGTLERSFNEMLARLGGIMRNIEESGRQMGQSVFQIAAISREIAEIGKNEQNRSAEVSAATVQLHQVSETVQQLAHDATSRATRTEEQARAGILTVQSNIAEMEQTVQEVNRAAAEIHELDAAAEQIHKIIDTIRTLAEQTNLLALNAAIEAARAGEQGRGFAVVADEVRKLAERTTGATGEISGIVGALTGKVGQVAATMTGVVERVHANQQTAGETANVIEQMAGDVTRTAAANQQISQVSSEQLDQFRRMNGTLENLFATLKESSSKVETTANIGDDLYAITQKLNAMMADFTFEHGEGRLAPAQHEKRRHPRAENHLLVHVHQNGRSIDGLSSDLSLSGARVRLSDQIEPDSPVELEWYLPYENLEQYRSQTPLRIAGRVAWQRREGDGYLCGIAFAALDAHKQQQLKRCFEFFGKNPEF